MSEQEDLMNFGIQEKEGGKWNWCSIGFVIFEIWQLLVRNTWVDMSREGLILVSTRIPTHSNSGRYAR